MKEEGLKIPTKPLALGLARTTEELSQAGFDEFDDGFFKKKIT